MNLILLPKNPNYYYLGIVQEKNKRYDRTHFNMVGGRKIVSYDDKNNIFLIESNDECAIRKLKEEVDISKYQHGIYLIKIITTDNEQISLRLIKN